MILDGDRLEVFNASEVRRKVGLAGGGQGLPGTDGDDGADGQGVPTGGTTNQVLAKVSNADFDTEWVDPAAGGGAPAVSEYLVGTADAILVNERLVIDTSTLVWDLSVAGQAKADVPDASTTAKGVVELATDGENAADVAVQGNDSRLSDDRDPTAHATTHQQGGADPIKLDDLATPEDNTDLNVSITTHGLTPKLPNDVTKYLNGTGAYSVPPGGSSFYTVSIVKSVNQDVTDNATVQNDAELLFPVVSGEVWLVWLYLLYAGNHTTGDYRYDFGLPTVIGWHRYLGDSTGTDTVNFLTNQRLASVTALAAQVICGTDASLTPRTMFHEFMFRANSTANFQFKFANSTAAAGRISRTVAGSLLVAKKLV